MEINNTILVVDDDTLLQKTTCQLLKLNGFKVQTADNGATGAQKAWEVFPDLILMDIDMPVMNGYEATRTLRKQGYKGPIVAFTGNTSEIMKTIEVGCTDMFEKHILDIDQFISDIYEHIEKSKMPIAV